MAPLLSRGYQSLKLDGFPTEISSFTRTALESSGTDPQMCIKTLKCDATCNEETPISKLPFELLSGVFLLCQRTEKGKSSWPSAITASHVCSHWRVVALSTPLLWNTIRINTSRCNILRLEAYLTRSNVCSLDISFEITNQNIRPIMDLLIAHGERWRTFSVRTFIDISDVLFEYLDSASTPLLERLYLSVAKCNLPYQKFPSACPKLVHLKAPSLRSLFLCEIAMANLQPPLENITTLELQAFYKLSVESSQFVRFFAGLPSLVNLSLCRLEFLDQPDPSVLPQRVTLPSLRSLRIRGQCQPTTQLSIFSLLLLPSLEFLVMSDLYVSQLSLLPSVKVLAIEECYELNESGFTGVFRSCPFVTDLTIVATNPPVYPSLTPADPHPKGPLHSLRRMKIKSLLECDIPPLRDMVSARIRYKCPLEELLFDSSSQTVLKKNKCLDWFTQRVLVKECNDVEPWSTVVGYHPVDLFG